MATWNRPGRPLVLASDSPRRKEILARMGFSFTVMRPRVRDERRFFRNSRFGDAAAGLALAKARSVSRQKPESLVFAGDTVVCCNGRVMGKPSTRNEARKMLAALSGKTHEVLSGVALVCEECGFAAAGAAGTKVTFRKLGQPEIEEYLENPGEYSDKAGAYAIQGKAMAFIDKINGCFYNVVGLPIAETIRLFDSYNKFICRNKS